MIFSASMKARAVQSNEKENTDICQSIDENQNVDEKQIIQKCLKLNEDISQVTENFLNCYNSLHKIKLRIDDWFKEIENTEGFDEFSKKVYKEFSKEFGMQAFKGRDISLDIVKKFFDNKENDEKAEKFKEELLKIIKKNSDIILDSCGVIYRGQPYYGYKIEAIVDKIRDFNELCDLSKDNISDKTKEILEVQKLILFRLESNFEQTKNDLNKWEKFLSEKNFYEHKLYVSRGLPYDEDRLEDNLRIKTKTKYFEQEKIILENLNKDLEKILKDNTNKA